MQHWAETQTAFADALLSPNAPAPDAIARTIPGAEQSKRFDVYRNNVVSTAIDALAETFPAVQRLVGEEFFRAVARAFLDTAPLASPILAEIGDGFGDFLDGFPPAAGVPYIGDVARIEAARIRSYHAADAQPLPLAVLGDIPPEQVGDVLLAPHPSAELIRSQHPAGSLWAASTDAMEANDVDMARAETVLIVRPALVVDTLILPPGGGGTFIASLFDGHSIAAAAEFAASEDESFDLSQHLTGAFGAGAFVSGRVPEPETDSA